VSDELVQVWQQRDGSWRWRYVVLDHTELRSNRGYRSAAEAALSARQAYPGVAVLGPVEDGSSVNGHHRGAGIVRIAMTSAAAAFVLLSVWYALRRGRRPVRRGR
jgi:hypothetical protein